MTNKETSLTDWHRQHNGKMVSFAGFEMPLHYGSQLDEHHYVRKSAGIFDVSHMRVIDFMGPDVKAYCRFLFANNIDKLSHPGKALYTCLLNESGGILDDLICYFVTDTHYRVVVNAATAEQDLAWFQRHANSYSVQINPRQDLSIIALQGPNACQLASIVLPEEIREKALALKPFNAVWMDNWFVARTGYTGEPGFEWIVPNDQVLKLWEQCVKLGFYPCGLGARDTLRLEAGLNLYGVDMNERVTPDESNLGWTVSLEPVGRAFIGREALMAQRKIGVTQKLLGLVLTGKGVLRNGQTVRLAQGEGVITSGSFAPTLQCSVALARLPITEATDCEVRIRDQWQSARLVIPPFFRAGKIIE